MNTITLIDKAFFLKKTLMFNTLDLDLLLAIADKLQVVSFESQESIFDPGEEAHRMYFIVRGEVEIRDAKKMLLATLGAHEFFGDESMFNEKPRAYEAVSKTKSILLTLSRTNLLTLISECPSVAVGILQAYTSITTFRPRKV